LKCRRCKQLAVVDLKNHNTAFCRDCYYLYMERQVKRAIHEHRMFDQSDRILVCVSGGKDSLVLWDLLNRLSYNCQGLYIDLGIEGYSFRSKEKVEKFATHIGFRLTVVSLKEHGIPIPEVAQRSRRSECSVCGTVKRHFFNRMAVEGKFTVVATGHNLDDECGRLLGNMLHWQWNYLAKQAPVLPARGMTLVRKVEPLCRLTERETAAYALLRGIDYVLEECPLSHGAPSNRYKQVLNLIEDWMPGTKGNFYQGFLRSAHLFGDRESILKKESDLPSICPSCGFPSFVEVCTFCRLTQGMSPRTTRDRKKEEGGSG
jgi:uncharacterized protein (TIGR00269 family)